MHRYVTFPAVNQYQPLSVYVAAAKQAKANPTATFKHSFDTWTPATGAEIHRQFIRAMHKRINRRGGESWRNNTTLEEIEERRDARNANTPHLIIRQFNSRAANRRLSHRLHTED